jgi:hypothetical protein
MSERQKNVCAICGLKCVTKPRLSVDHCHSTGRIRGLLCGVCNTGFGMFKNSPELLRKAALYAEGKLNEPVSSDPQAAF